MTQNKNTAAAAQAAVITKGAPQNTNSSAQAAEIVQRVVNAANKSAAIAELIPLQRFLHTIVGLNQTQCVAVAT